LRGGARPLTLLAAAGLDAVGVDPSTILLERAIARGRIGEPEAHRWLDRQHARDANGEFHSTISKVLIVASKR
jgi:hypothetical protein